MVKDFKIILDLPPEGIFSPGSDVNGSVIVEVDKPKHYKRISVSILGKGRVQWTESDGEASTTHNGQETYVDLTINVWEKEQSSNGELSPDRHSFPFQFALPKQIPSSWSAGPDDKGAEGKITYTVGAVIVNSGLKFEHEIKESIKVVSTVDINTDNLSKPAYGVRNSASCCLFCASGSIDATVEVPRTGFCVGELIPFRVVIENGSSRRLRASASLMELAEYTTRDAHYKPHPVTQVAVRNSLIPAHCTVVWSSEMDPLRVPQQAPTTFRVGVARLYYILKFVVFVPGLKNCVFKLPVTIGNVPYQLSDLYESNM